MQNQLANLTDMMSKFMSANTASSSGSWTLPGNTITNPKEDLKGITTRSGVAYQGPTIPTPFKIAKQGIEVTKDQVQTPNSQSTAPVQTTVIQSESETSVFEPVVAPVSAPMPNLKPSIPYPSRRDNERRHRLVSKPISIVKDVSVKVGVFHFPADFVVVDFKPDPRVPLILRSPTPFDGPIISTTSPTLTPFRDSDFLLFEEADAFLGLEDDPDSPELDPSYYDIKGDILLLEAILNSDPSSPLPNHEQSVPSFKEELKAWDILLLEAILNSDPSSPLPNHEQSVPSFKEELKACEAKTIKSSIDEPPEVELKDLPPHLEYAFLEGDNKLPVIITKELGEEEKSALIKVLKSYKRAIAWKLSDIQGINPEFCTHKILMEEDNKLAVQHQRRVNPKIHDVIKKEVEKLLDAGLIYSISDSPWVSPIHCVPKKGGFTIVANEENELIPTRLVTGWRVYIDYRKLNEATRKDHFPHPFMDQMLERLAGNEYYCFFDGFSGYFQILIDPRDQETTTFTCPYGTFIYRRMPFGLCNAPGTFQRCVMDDVIQHSIPQVIHTTPPDKDYVASTTKSILGELLEEFRDEILNITVVDEEADCNLLRIQKSLKEF
nr:reverse transcriptase domain-containing protein [Tanacetum cinerariifolium]